MATATPDTIPIEVSEDRLRAELILGKVDPENVTAENVNARLQERGISATEGVRNRVKELVALAKSGGLSLKPFLLAEGRLPKPGVAARVELAWPEDEQDEDDDHTDFYRSRILTVQEGDVVGTYFPEVPPTHGIDVFGKQIPGAQPTSVQIGENVTLAEDGTTLIASIAGQVQLARREVFVVEVIEIKSDVDFSTGNIESPTNVLINGTVRDAFCVKSEKSITVRGAIEAATVEAGDDIRVVGGVASRNQGSVAAKGEIHTKFCSEAHLQAEGDITITHGCMNSHVHTCGRLMVPQGKVVGGFTYAREGAEIKVLGNNADRKTEIAIGLDPVALMEASRIDEIIKKKKEASSRIREKTQPLIDQLKRLTSEQRERVTELMYQADTMDAEIQEHEEKKRELIAAKSPTGKASLLVTSIIYPGVKVIFGDKMATFRQERRGPVKIERRMVDRVEEICMIDRSSGSVMTMPTYDYVFEEASPDEEA